MLKNQFVAEFNRKTKAPNQTAINALARGVADASIWTSKLCIGCFTVAGLTYLLSAPFVSEETEAKQARWVKASINVSGVALPISFIAIATAASLYKDEQPEQPEQPEYPRTKKHAQPRVETSRPTQPAQHLTALPQAVPAQVESCSNCAFSTGNQLLPCFVNPSSYGQVCQRWQMKPTNTNYSNN